MTRKKLQQKTSSADVQVQVNNTKDDFSSLTLTTSSDEDASVFTHKTGF
jgi:hypothetical protein